MKAIVLQQFGSSEVLRLQDVNKPTPKDDEVLVKIHAASVNPLDWHWMRGEPRLMRFEMGFTKPKVNRLGADLAGYVEAVGKNVSQFQIGDAVFGEKFETGLGGFAEYASVPENALVLKPDNISMEQAAAVPIAALTALYGLCVRGQIQAGQQVLINGASGGVGTFAVQIAKAFDTEVTAVCSIRNLDLVRSIGADHVIDYTREDFTNHGQQYDLIFDAVGNRSVASLMRTLKPHGICSIAGFTTLPRLFEHIGIGALVSRMGSKTVGMMTTFSANQQDLQFLKDLLEAGKIIPVIDRCYPLSETPQAIGYLETGRARGKVIIAVQ